MKSSSKLYHLTTLQCKLTSYNLLILRLKLALLKVYYDKVSVLFSNSNCNSSFITNSTFLLDKNRRSVMSLISSPHKYGKTKDQFGYDQLISGLFTVKVITYFDSSFEKELFLDSHLTVVKSVESSLEGILLNNIVLDLKKVFGDSVNPLVHLISAYNNIPIRSKISIKHHFFKNL